MYIGSESGDICLWRLSRCQVSAVSGATTLTTSASVNATYGDYNYSIVKQEIYLKIDIILWLTIIAEALRRT